MANIGTVQAIGNANSTLPEVETAPLALRVVNYPVDRGGLSGGVYSIAASFVPYTASAAFTFGPVLALQWLNKSTILRLKKLLVSQGEENVAITGAAAGTVVLQAHIGRNFTAQYSGSTANINPPWPRLRSTMSLLGDISEAGATASLVTVVANLGSGMTGGTVILDLPFAAIATSGKPGSALPPPISPYPMWDTSAGDHPIDLIAGMGIVLQLGGTYTVGSGTPSQPFYVVMTVEELPVGGLVNSMPIAN